MLKEGYGKDYHSTPLIEEEEHNLKKLFGNGSRCGEISEEIMIQFYIPNFLTIYGHRFQLKAFMFIASSNPGIVYYHDGYVKINLDLYDPKTPEKVKD